MCLHAFTKKICGQDAQRAQAGLKALHGALYQPNPALRMEPLEAVPTEVLSGHAHLPQSERARVFKDNVIWVCVDMSEVKPPPAVVVTGAKRPRCRAGPSAVGGSDGDGDGGVEDAALTELEEKTMKACIKKISQRATEMERIRQQSKIAELEKVHLTAMEAKEQEHAQALKELADRHAAQLAAAQEGSNR
jgi:hypothetical protein